MRPSWLLSEEAPDGETEAQSVTSLIQGHRVLGGRAEKRVQTGLLDSKASVLSPYSMSFVHSLIQRVVVGLHHVPGSAEDEVVGKTPRPSPFPPRTYVRVGGRQGIVINNNNNHICYHYEIIS